MERQKASTPMQSKFLPRYDVVQEDELNYVFTTDSESLYRLSFIPFCLFEGVPDGTLFVFNIDRDFRGRKADDGNKIRNTVAYVLNLFFSQIENAILTTCEVDDGMQLSRKRLFDRWYRQMNDGRILTMTARQQTGYGVTDATLYYHRDNMFRKILEQQFSEYIALMNSLE